MHTTIVSVITFVCAFGGALLGLFLRTRLPHHHLSSDSKDTVKLGMGLVGTMTALLLSLLVASAKSSYDVRKDEITQMSARIAFLDRVLANYGPETEPQRQLLRSQVQSAISTYWSHEDDGSSAAATAAPQRTTESLYHAIHQLKPTNDLQQDLKGKALEVAEELGQARWLLVAQSGTSISTPFLVVTIMWLSVLFVSFGLFAPANLTVFCALFMCALSVSGALFLVLELDHPFTGLIQISSEPMRLALAALGQ